MNQPGPDLNLHGRPYDGQLTRQTVHRQLQPTILRVPLPLSYT